MTRSQTLPVNDADAAQLAVQRLREEVAQHMLGLSDIESVQIEFRLDPILAASQLAQDRTLEARTVKHELISGRQRRIVAPPGKALSQNSMPICAREARSRCRARPPRLGTLAGHSLDVPHSLAEEAGVVVLGSGFHN